MGSGINNKINEFLCKPKNVRKRNTRLEKCYGHVNLATTFKKIASKFKFSGKCYFLKIKNCTDDHKRKN